MSDQRYLARRAGAVMVDSLLANGVQLLCLVPVVWVVGSYDMNEDSSVVLAVVVSIVAVVGALGSVALFVIRDRFHSPGKRIFGLNVVDEKTGEPCTLMQAFLRGIVYIMLGIIDLVVPFVREDGKRLGDLVAGTRVVQAH